MLLVTHDVTENAWWIAAISYLLGERLARQMTFTTYSHRPGYSRYPPHRDAAGVLPPDADAASRSSTSRPNRPPARPSTRWPRLLAEHRGDGRGGAVAAGGGLRRRDRTRLDDWLAPGRRGGRAARPAS